MNKALKYLFGKSEYFPNPLKNRTTVLNFPALDDNEEKRTIRYASADGVILYLIKRIEKLENKLNKK